MTTVWTAAIAFSAVQFPVPPPVEPGERIVNTVCVRCYELRPIETKALDKEDWAEVVNSMVEKGLRLYCSGRGQLRLEV